MLSAFVSFAWDRYWEWAAPDAYGEAKPALKQKTTRASRRSKAIKVEEESSQPVAHINERTSAAAVKSDKYDSAFDDSDLGDSDLEEALRKCEVPYPRLPSVSSSRTPSSDEVSVDAPHQSLNRSVAVGPANFSKAPLHVRWECQRAAEHYGIPILHITRQYDPSWQDYDVLKKHLQMHCPPGHEPLPAMSAPDVWEAACNGFKSICLSGSFDASSLHKNPPIFKLTLNALKYTEGKRSNRFQRRFGFENVLNLTLPYFHYEKVKGRDPQVFSKALVQWLMTKKRLLGKTWRVLQIDESSGSKKNGSWGGAGKRKKQKVYEIVLIAVNDTASPYSPPDAPTYSFADVLEWYFALGQNEKMPYLKLYSRVALGLSMTHPSYVFKATEIRMGEDVLADGTAEDKRFNEARRPVVLRQWMAFQRHYDPGFKCGKRSVMNDGCSYISEAAARAIWRALGRTDPLPTLFQGRIGAAKGVWTVVAGDEVWIQITPSQRKLQPHAPESPWADDEAHRTFEVVNWSKPPTSSATLNLAFLPIMADRGVPWQAIESIVRQHFSLEEEIFDCIDTSEEFLYWLSRRGLSSQFEASITNATYRGGLPLKKTLKAACMCHAGFVPREFSYLARLTKEIVDDYLTSLVDKFSIPLPRSVNLYAIADPLGVLNPGEIHVSFSEGFLPEGLEYPIAFLNDVDVLLARFPCNRNSDIQRVRAVYYPELAGFPNVAIFPAKGCVPLAERMSNGDYDGDTFWITWEPSLVQPFRNAPPPCPPKPESYDITQDRRPVWEVLAEGGTDNLLRECFTFILQDDLLGSITSTLKKHAYATNCVRSNTLDCLADMADLLVDRKKQGYHLDHRTWLAFQTRHNIARFTKPGYELSLAEPNPTFNPSHILDHLKFAVFKPLKNDLLQRLDTRLATARPDDADLAQPYYQWRQQAASDPALERERQHLLSRLADLARTASARTASFDDYTDRVSRLGEAYAALVPLDRDLRRHWVDEDPTPGPGRWELLKASTLYSQCLRQGGGRLPDGHVVRGNADVLFTWAGRELLFLKALARSPRAFPVCTPVLDTLKPRRRALVRVLEDGEEEEEEEEEEIGED